MHTLDQYQWMTFHIVYMNKTNPRGLETFVWQEYDMAPSYPRLHAFVEYWERHKNARLHSVQVGDETILEGAGLNQDFFSGMLH